ncbi:hypothetical protein H310_10708 [Aphanomyces invadans]|uniref:Uncharacterized protein n=1 Tax=Aphanomyces invadans TaxID=157072 RepID=A0A024TRU5_9STRA|nr:hypothetical protein H310_10708 [Aphanomyces invadans]ETV96062.1 hypothetical protein H310_10708 [Aphanomyces invadans]|eukprot:XP_008875373.1 hypothetical protein H310_10708 [Aphanomyces invadans]
MQTTTTCRTPTTAAPGPPPWTLHTTLPPPSAIAIRLPRTWNGRRRRSGCCIPSLASTTICLQHLASAPRPVIYHRLRRRARSQDKRSSGYNRIVPLAPASCCHESFRSPPQSGDINRIQPDTNPVSFSRRNCLSLKIPVATGSPHCFAAIGSGVAILVGYFLVRMSRSFLPEGTEAATRGGDFLQGVGLSRNVWWTRDLASVSTNGAGMIVSQWAWRRRILPVAGPSRTIWRKHLAR